MNVAMDKLKVASARGSPAFVPLVLLRTGGRVKGVAGCFESGPSAGSGIGGQLKCNRGRMVGRVGVDSATVEPKSALGLFGPM